MKESTPLDRLVQAATTGTPDAAFLRTLAVTANTRNAELAGLRKKGYSAEHVAEQRDVAKKELAAMIEAHEAAVRKAHETAVDAAKSKYISEATTPAKLQEAALFRDRVSASSDRALVAAANSGDPTPEQMLILGGELRRRGLVKEADRLAIRSEPSRDPWESDPAISAAAEHVSVWDRARTSGKMRVAMGMPGAKVRLMVPLGGGQHVSADDLLSGASDEA
jgi:hypothetical protein